MAEKTQRHAEGTADRLSLPCVEPNLYRLSAVLRPPPRTRRNAPTSYQLSTGWSRSPLPQSGRWWPVLTAYRHHVFFMHISISSHMRKDPHRRTSITALTFYVVRTIDYTCWESSPCSKIGPAPLDPARSLACYKRQPYARELNCAVTRICWLCAGMAESKSAVSKADRVYGRSESDSSGEETTIVMLFVRKYLSIKHAAPKEDG